MQGIDIYNPNNPSIQQSINPFFPRQGRSVQPFATALTRNVQAHWLRRAPPGLPGLGSAKAELLSARPEFSRIL